MKKFRVTSYDFQGTNTPAIDVVIEADVVKYEDNRLILFKKKLTDPPVAIFDIGRVWIREKE
jgi:predicted nicotinamide N-methyase